jgi:adenosylmethionine-8-amino-7-oxononanoate aminotransferase
MSSPVVAAAPEEIVQRDRDLLIHPYLPGAVQERIVMREGRGCRLRDIEGREYLDATGGLWLAQVGHGRPELADAAATQMRSLEYFTSFWEFSNERAIELAQRLVEISPPSVRNVYYTSGGSDRTWILARERAYHGLGYGSGSATGFELYKDGFGPMLPNFRHLTAPWPYRTELYGGHDPTDFLIDELERVIDELGPDHIAAMIGEPIMGVAGMLVPPDDYWPRVREVLDRHGILLIFDEVVTAYGRTGEWFAAQHFGVEPDMITTAKGITSGYLPLGAVLVSDEVADVARSEGLPVAFTYCGHPTACAVALTNLEIIEREGLLAKAREVGGYLLDELRTLNELPIVGEVRGVGMMLAVELVADKATREPLPMDGALHDVIRRETGVIVRDGATTLVLSPPLVMSRDEADEVVAAIRTVLARTGVDGRVRPRREPRTMELSTS